MGIVGAILLFILIFIVATAYTNQVKIDGDTKFLGCAVTRQEGNNEVALNSTQIKDKVFGSMSFAKLFLQARGGEIRQGRHNSSQYYFYC